MDVRTLLEVDDEVIASGMLGMLDMHRVDVDRATFGVWIDAAKALRLALVRTIGPEAIAGALVARAARHAGMMAPPRAQEDSPVVTWTEDDERDAAAAYESSCTAMRASTLADPPPWAELPAAARAGWVRGARARRAAAARSGAVEANGGKGAA